jgi:DNA-binding protein HU-beta
VTKAELIAAMAEKAGLKPDQAKVVLDAFTAVRGRGPEPGRGRAAGGLRHLHAREKPARTARNPRTGEAVSRPEHRAVKFRVGEGLKGAVA